MTDSASGYDEVVDVLVVGSGGGGLCGAYTAAREGLTVTLVEASDQFGGTTAYSAGGGMWYPANPVYQREGVDDTVEDAFEYYHAVVGDRTPLDLQETYIRGGSPLIAYLEQDAHLSFEAYPWIDYFGSAPKARLDGKRHIIPTPLPVSQAPELRELVRGPLDNDRLGTPKPDDLFIGGRALIARFLTAISAYENASLHLSTTMTQLLTDDSGKVIGAVVDRDGTPTRIRAERGVLLATGGFEADRNLREHYGVPGRAEDTMGPPTNDGSALRAALAAGADTDLMDQAWWSPGLTHPDGRSAFALGFVGGIFVNQNGERFVNESAPYDSLARTMLDLVDSGDLAERYWMIYDDAGEGRPPILAPNVTMADTAEFVAAGLWHSADTLEELATKIGVPGEALVATVRRFNEQVDTGRDADFGRGDEAYDRLFTDGAVPFTRIEKGPFHAAAFGFSDLGTKGGVRTDVHGRVLDHDGAPIEGLYAAGNTMAAPSGTVYPGGGNPIGTSVLFSHLAAKHMAA